MIYTRPAPRPRAALARAPGLQAPFPPDPECLHAGLRVPFTPDLERLSRRTSSALHAGPRVPFTPDLECRSRRTSRAFHAAPPAPFTPDFPRLSRHQLLLPRSTYFSRMSWSAAAICSNWTPMPTFRSLQATRPVASISDRSAGQAQRDVNGRARRQRIHRADRQAALAHVEGRRAGDRPASAKRDRHAHRHARARAAIEIVRKQVRRQGRQNLRRTRVLVDVRRDAESRQLLHLSGRGERAREHHDRQRLPRLLPQRAHELDAVLGQAQIQQHEIDRGRGDSTAATAAAAVGAWTKAWRASASAAANRSEIDASRCATRIVLTDMRGSVAIIGIRPI